MTEEIKPVMDIKVGKRHFLMTSCHRIPERSFHYKGKPVLCYRCLGLNGGFFLFTFIQLILGIISLSTGLTITITPLINQYISKNLLIKFLLIIMTQLPFIIDGSLQAIWNKYTSNNITRSVTGFIGGFGQFYLFVFLGDLIRSI